MTPPMRSVTTICRACVPRRGTFYAELKQLQILTYTVPLSALGLSTTFTGFIYLFLVCHQRLALRLTMVELVFFVIGFGVTVLGHFLINNQIV